MAPYKVQFSQRIINEGSYILQQELNLSFDVALVVWTPEITLFCTIPHDPEDVAAKETFVMDEAIVRKSGEKWEAEALAYREATLFVVVRFDFKSDEMLC